MTSRRYELRLFHYGRRLLRDEKSIVGMDLTTGPGVEYARAVMDDMFARLCSAARVNKRDMKDCRIEAIDEETGESIFFYPPVVE